MHPTQNLYRRPKRPIVIPARVAGRAATRWEQNENNCWISTYSVASHGYAQIGWQDGDYRQVVTAHRAAWVHKHGQQIPEGMTVDHTCKERRCVNPAHLRLMSNFENARRTDGRDWKEGECIHGHPNSELVRHGKKWLCRECKRIHQLEYRHRSREKVLQRQREYRAANKEKLNAKQRERRARARGRE